MTEPILEAARKFLVDFLQGKNNPRETLHPWRKGWEFTVLHALRVEALVLKILEQEPHTLNEAEITILRLAALLHDIGRLENTDRHAQLGAEIIDRWLQETPAAAALSSNGCRLCALIADHSDKDGPDNDFARAVLKDADSLDEIGAMSIFMTANWLDRQSPFFFHQLLERLRTNEIPYCQEKLARLNTEAARMILHEKQALIVTFISQLSAELEGTL